VSQQIGKLERDLHCRLLERHPRGVTLTPVGQALLAHAETVVGELRAAEVTVQGMLGAEPSRLAVGTFPSAGRSLVPQALARFRRQHPGTALTLLDLEPPDGYGLVSSGNLDLLITHRYPGMPLPDCRGLCRQLLMHDPLRLVLPAGHPKAREPRLTVARLAGEEWISGSAGIPNRACLDLVARSTGVAPHVAYETRDYQVHLALIEAGLGIGLVPASVLDYESGRRLAVRQLDDASPAREIFLVYRKRSAALVTDMISMITPRAAGGS
jgi:DNA-binding transcriptional LysR family regulator